jgi:hypothetical protein
LRAIHIPVQFESAAALKAMTDAGDANLGERLLIEVLNCDCELEFPGYSVSQSMAGDGSVHLVRTELEEDFDN